MLIKNKNYITIFIVLVAIFCCSIVTLSFYAITVKTEINSLKKSVLEANEPIDNMIAISNQSLNIKNYKLKLDNEILIAKVEELNNKLIFAELSEKTANNQLRMALASKGGSGGGGGSYNCEKYIEENFDLKIKIKNLENEIKNLTKSDSLK